MTSRPTNSRPLPERRAGAPPEDRGLRLRDEVEHPAPVHRVRLRRPRVPGDRAGVRAAGDSARRRVPQQRPGRSRGRLIYAIRERARSGEIGCAGVRHLPRPPDPVAGDGRRDLQAQVRTPRRQPSGEGTRDRQGRNHVAESRLCRRPRHRCRPTSSVTHVEPVRRHG